MMSAPRTGTPVMLNRAGALRPDSRARTRERPILVVHQEVPMRFHMPRFHQPLHDPVWMEEAGWILFFMAALLAMLLWPSLRG